jgi:hypothetical protein
MGVKLGGRERIIRLIANPTAPFFPLSMNFHQIPESGDLANLTALSFPLATNVPQSTDPANLTVLSFLPAMNSLPFQPSGQSVPLSTSVQEFPLPNLEPLASLPAKEASASAMVLPIQTHSKKENDPTGAGKAGRGKKRKGDGPVSNQDGVSTKGRKKCMKNGDDYIWFVHQEIRETQIFPVSDDKSLAECCIIILHYNSIEDPIQ